MKTKVLYFVLIQIAIDFLKQNTFKKKKLTFITYVAFPDPSHVVFPMKVSEGSVLCPTRVSTCDTSGPTTTDSW